MFRPQPARHRRYLATAIIMLSMLTGVMLMFAYQAGGSDADISMPKPSVPTHDPAMIAAGEATKLTVDAKEDAQQKAAVATAIRSDQLGLPNPKDSNNRPPTPVPMPIETIEAETLLQSANGIDFIQSSSSSWIHRYRFNNIWSGIVNNHQVSLFTGSKVGYTDTDRSPEQGVILYSTMQNGAMDMEYLTATRAGSLTFIDANGTCLTAKATDGTTFMFNAATRTWACPTEK